MADTVDEHLGMLLRAQAAFAQYGHRAFILPTPEPKLALVLTPSLAAVHTSPNLNESFEAPMAASATEHGGYVGFGDEIQVEFFMVPPAPPQAIRLCPGVMVMNGDGFVSLSKAEVAEMLASERPGRIAPMPSRMLKLWQARLRLVEEARHLQSKPPSRPAQSCS